MRMFAPICGIPGNICIRSLGIRSGHRRDNRAWTRPGAELGLRHIRLSISVTRSAGERVSLQDFSANIMPTWAANSAILLTSISTFTEYWPFSRLLPLLMTSHSCCCVCVLCWLCWLAWAGVAGAGLPVWRRRLSWLTRIRLSWCLVSE